MFSSCNNSICCYSNLEIIIIIIVFMISFGSCWCINHIKFFQRVTNHRLFKMVLALSRFFMSVKLFRVFLISRMWFGVIVNARSITSWSRSTWSKPYLSRIFAIVSIFIWFTLNRIIFVFVICVKIILEGQKFRKNSICEVSWIIYITNFT